MECLVLELAIPAQLKYKNKIIIRERRSRQINETRQTLKTYFNVATGGEG